jgi:predicted ferric reductase
VDLGVFSLYGLVIVLLSSWLRRYIKHASWRALHYTSFAVFLLVTLHGVLAGSDSGQPWMILVYLGASAAVVVMTLIRILWVPESAPAPARSTSRGP